MNKVDCIGCHGLGQEATRTVPAAFGEFKSGEEAWMRRVASGQTGEWMVNRLAGQLGSVPFKYFGDWTDLVAKGELPKTKAAGWYRAQRCHLLMGIGHGETLRART